MDVERDEETEPQGGWEWVKTQEEKMKKEREEVCSLYYQMIITCDLVSFPRIFASCLFFLRFTG